MTQLSRFWAKREKKKRLARGLQVRELQFCCARSFKVRGGIDSSWVGTASRKEGCGVSSKSTRDELELKRALTRPSFP